MPAIDSKTDAEIDAWYTNKYIESIGCLSPGLTMVIMHCTRPSSGFSFIAMSIDPLRSEAGEELFKRVERRIC